MSKSMVATDYTRMRKAQLIEKLRDLECEVERLVQTGTVETTTGGMANDDQRRFHDFAEMASDWFWETDEHLRFTYFSCHHDDVGLEIKKTLGKTRPEITIEDTAQKKWRDHLADLAAQERFKDFRYLSRARDGRVIHLSVSGKPIIDDAGKFKGYRGTGTDITALINAENEIKTASSLVASAQEQFMAAIESVSDGFALFDADDRMVFCNSRFKELNPDLAPKIVPGISFEEMLRDNIVTNRILDALGDEEAFIRERMEQHRNPSRPLVQQRRDGRWLELREERTPEGSTFLVNTDITERKRAEDALRDSRDRIRLIANNLPAAIVYFDTEQRYHFVNDTAQKWFARPKENILGHTIEEIVGSEAQEQLSAYLEAAFSGKEQRFELDMTYPDGETRAVEITYAPHLDASGEVPGCFALVHDITERKCAEEALHTREAQLRGIMDNAPIEIVLKDTEGHYVLTNARWQKNYNLTDEEAKGRTLHDFFPEEFANPLSAHEREVMETGEAAAHENKFPQSDGIHDFLTITFPIRDTAGEVMNFGVMAVDITERKRAEETILMAKEQAELANRTKSQFLANMSHELRTPLNAIIGFSEIIKDEAFGPVGCTKYCDYVNDINESGQHLLDLINDILDLSKIESGAGELQKEIVEIRTLVRSIVTLVTGRVKKSSVELEINMPDDVPPLHADSRKLKQILINLLSNAFKFTPAGGKVTLKIWCRVESGYVFQVVDTGIGIALDDIPKALAPFQQVDSELSRKYEGTGLGLPLTKALVEMHGGYLDLQSEVGVGTTVTVRFPAECIVELPRDTESIDTAAKKVG